MPDPNVEKAIAQLLDILTMRFGSLPTELAAEIRFQSDLPRLKSFFLPAVKASTLEEFRKATLNRN